MSTPGTGTPDWQVFSTLHSATLYDANVTVLAGTNVSLGQFDTSSFNAVHVSISGVTNGGTFTLLSGETFSNVSDDIAGQWVVRPDTHIEVTAPLPRKKLTVSVTAQAGLDWNFSARIALTNVADDRHHYYGTGAMLGANNVAIGAGVLQSYFPTTLLPGPAHLWVFNGTPANQLTVSVKTRKDDGTSDLFIAQIQSVVAESNLDLIIPTRLYQVDVQNTGAGADTYYFSLCTTGMQT